MHGDDRALEDEDYELEVQGHSLFIPLGPPRHREGDFYSASDPEWQEFVRIAKDDKKMKSLKGGYSDFPVPSGAVTDVLTLVVDELANIVLKTSTQSKELQQLLGSPVAISAYWLIHRFPTRASPTYWQLGYVYARPNHTCMSCVLG